MTASAADVADPGYRKQVETLRARAALAGFVLSPLPDGSFVVSRWGLSRELPHLAAVESWLRRAAGDA